MGTRQPCKPAIGWRGKVHLDHFVLIILGETAPVECRGFGESASKPCDGLKLLPTVNGEGSICWSQSILLSGSGFWLAANSCLDVAEKDERVQVTVCGAAAQANTWQGSIPARATDDDACAFSGAAMDGRMRRRTVCSILTVVGTHCSLDTQTSDMLDEPSGFARGIACQRQRKGGNILTFSLVILADLDALLHIMALAFVVHIPTKRVLIDGEVVELVIDRDKANSFVTRRRFGLGSVLDLKGVLDDDALRSSLSLALIFICSFCLSPLRFKLAEDLRDIFSLIKDMTCKNLLVDVQ